MGAMTVPYVFAGVAVSLALTRSPFPVSLVYGVDLLGAALGCAAVVGILNVLDGPSAILLAGLLSAASAFAFANAAPAPERAALAGRRLWRRPAVAVLVLAASIPLNQAVPVGFKPVMVKDALEGNWANRTERWNSDLADRRVPAIRVAAELWGTSPYMPNDIWTQQAALNIDGAAGTLMHHFGGTRESIDFLKYDLVNLAYHLPGLRKGAVIGVGVAATCCRPTCSASATSPASNSTRSSSTSPRHPVPRLRTASPMPGVTLECRRGAHWFASVGASPSIWFR